jgi:hypothetical protein
MAASTYTENSQVVLDQKTIQGEQYLASYAIATASVSMSGANIHLLEIMAGASLNVRIRRIEVWESVAGSSLIGLFSIYRLSSAGTGGTAYTPSPLDTSDAPSGATAMTLPTVKGTEGVLMHAASASTSNTSLIRMGLLYEVDFDRDLRVKPVIIPAGTSNGIAIKSITTSTTQVYVNVWFTETSF